MGGSGHDFNVEVGFLEDGESLGSDGSGRPEDDELALLLHGGKKA